MIKVKSYLEEQPELVQNIKETSHLLLKEQDKLPYYHLHKNNIAIKIEDDKNRG